MIILMASCGESTNQVRVEGDIDGASNKMIYIREVGHNAVNAIDSAVADKHGKFEFILETGDVKFILLQVANEAEPVVLLVEPGEEVFVGGSINGLACNYSVTGSRGSSLVRDLNNNLNQTISTIDTLARRFRVGREMPRFDTIKPLIDSAYDKAIREHKHYTVNFIKENRYSLASVLALYQQYDRRTYVLNTRDDFELFQLVDSSLYPLYPNNPLVQNMHKNVEAIANQLKLYDKRQDMIAEGQLLPKLLFPLISGDTIRLNDIRSRYVLIDFWALWCNNCQEGISDMRSLYDKYSSKGFQILQVSLDKDSAALKEWYRTDSISWLVASDYMQWESPLLDSLSINSIPSNYLVDRRGVVRGRNLKMSELDEILSNMLR